MIVFLVAGVSAAAVAAVDFTGSPVETDLVAEYRFDTGAGETAYDTSGSQDGTLSSASWGEGVKDDALKLDGSNDYVSTGIDIDQSNGGGSYSFCAWTKLRSTGGGTQQIVSSDNGGFDWSILKGNNDQYALFDGSGVLSSGVSTDTKWHHVCGVFNNPEDEARLYLDGKLTESSDLDYDTSDSNIRVGSNPTSGEHWGGKIDNTLIYSKALSSSRVKSIYNSGSWRVGTKTGGNPSRTLDITFQHRNSTHIFDTSGYENHGQNNGAEQEKSVECIVGRCSDFEGGGDHVLVDQFTGSFSDAVSITGWLNPDKIQGDNRQWLVEDGNGFMSYVDSTNSELKFRVNAGGSQTTLNTGYSVQEDSWQHVALVYDGTQMRAYVDGSLEGTTAKTGNLQNIQKVSVGGDSHDSEDWYNGQIDEVSIHNTSLSDEEVWKTYSQGRDSGVKTKGPVARYPIQTSSSPLTDISGEGIDGETPLVGETGTFNSSNGDWKTVRFERRYRNPVVIGTTNTQNGEPGLVFEAKNVDASSAELRLCESEGPAEQGCDTHGTERGGYIVANPSATDSVSGIEAGNFSVDGEIDTTTETITYSESFSTEPGVFLTVQTDKGPGPVTSWPTSTTTNGFTAGICEQETEDGCNSSHPTETVGWVALESGNLPFQQQAEASTTGNVQNSQYTQANYADFQERPVGLFGIQENADTEDSKIGEIRNLNSDSMEVRLCELDSRDSCDSHPSTSYAYFAAEEGVLSNNFGDKPEFVETRRGQSLSFDGVDDSVKIESSELLEDDFLKDSITLVARASPDQCTGRHSIIAKSSATGNANYQLLLESDCSVSFKLDGAGGTQTTNEEIETDKFTHIAAMYNGSRRVVYIGGEVADSISASGNIADASGSPVTMGSRAGNNQFFDGKIESAIIFPYGLSASDINETTQTEFAPTGGNYY